MRLRLDPFIVALLTVALTGVLFPAQGRALDAVQTVSLAVIAGLFFLYGARLSTTEALAGAARWRVHIVIVTITFVLFPALGLAVEWVAAAWWSAPLASGLLLLCLVPSTVQGSVAFTGIAGGDRAVAVVAASLSNLLGVVITPLLVAVLMGGDSHVTFGSVARIVGLLLVPFLLAQILRRWWVGGFVARHHTLLKGYDRGSILFVVYVAFSSGTNAGVWSAVSWVDGAVLLAIVAALLILGLGVAALLARPYERPQRIAILFCGSNKSLASGLPMATVLLPPDQVALLILPLMAYHQLQLITCTLLANRIARQDGNATA
ncbi:bile acid:sodium symporter [Aeromicrobium phragmitis]|uniref:Bile acid:sodium symporter n=1 Tax=Aeromicrobium phragmitis TaxID=2478914 RepID=A0A3L8PM61_9ACTN|nr:bile acid:sodium symporter family protein [Aeromicrobium phragmitis]RLV56314.1 bile acid:sodium symporter [Aeromicrobium phragmitis]